ncbi:MAG: sugar ABC transporter substrate-binding protein [Christensenellales bacterium]|jgi:ABC-type sugar transport system substrate-binding protein
MKKALCILLALTMLFVLVACGSNGETIPTTAPDGGTTAADDSTAAPDDSSTAPDDDTASGTMKLGVSWNFMINESATETKAFIDEMANERGFSVVHLVADGDAAQQIADVKDLVSQKCDVVAVVPVDSSASTTMIQTCQDAGIPYINFNRPLSAETSIQPAASIVPDSEGQAYDSCVSCIDQMLEAGITQIRILNIIGSLTDENAVNRDKGVKRCVEDYKAKDVDVEILADLECDWDNEWITSNLPASLNANPDANMIYNPSDYCAGAVAASLETAGRWVTYEDENHVWVASTDVYIDGYQYLLEGYFDSNTLLSNTMISEAVVEAAEFIYNGGDYGDDWDILVPCPLYIRDNAQDKEMIDLLSYKDQL